MRKKEKRILIIGAGRMARAIISGLCNKSTFSIKVTNNGNKDRLEYVSQTFGIQKVRQLKAEIKTSDIILLAIPPEVHKTLLQDISKEINGQLVVTVAAGIGPSYIEQYLPQGTPVAWVMPNTAASLSQSSTLYAPGKYVDEEHKVLLEQLLEGIGDFEQVSEKQVSELTALTGSAPAFIYEMANSLVNVAMDTGISERQAKKLIAQMVAGSAAMLQTGEAPGDLSQQVATPGGSTAEGLKVLKQNSFDKIMREAINACRVHVRNNSNNEKK